MDYFPYPSGEGLHVGHCRNYIPTDVISRFKRMKGYNVLHQQKWQSYDHGLSDVVTKIIPVQINGKFRDSIQAVMETAKITALETALETPFARKYLDGREITQVVYVPGKILNVITK